MPKPHKFKELKGKMEAKGKIDLEDFNSVQDMMTFLDYYNSQIDRKKEDVGDDDIMEISKMVARMMNKKTIV
jgi:hypothetical protein